MTRYVGNRLVGDIREPGDVGWLISHGGGSCRNSGGEWVIMAPDEGEWRPGRGQFICTWCDRVYDVKRYR